MYNKYVQMFEAVTVAIVTAAVGFISIYVNNDCTPMKENTKEMHVKVWLVWVLYDIQVWGDAWCNG